MSAENAKAAAWMSTGVFIAVGLWFVTVPDAGFWGQVLFVLSLLALFICWGYAKSLASTAARPPAPASPKLPASPPEPFFTPDEVLEFHRDAAAAESGPYQGRGGIAAAPKAPQRVQKPIPGVRKR